MRPGTYRAGVERGLQRSFTALALMLALPWAATLTSAGGRLDAWTAVAGWLFVGSLLYEAVRAWRSRLGPPEVWTACGAAALVDVAVAVSRPEVLVVGARGNPALVAALLAAGFLPRARAWPVCVLVCLAQVFASARLDGPWGALEGLWPVVSGAVAAGVVSAVMRTAAARADRAHEGLLAARAAEAEAEGRRAAHRTFQRMLHDDVAAALRAVALPGVDWAAARQACERALVAISRAPRAPAAGSRNLGADVAELGAVLPQPIAVHTLADVPVPHPVAAAMLAAAREALRNVGRHAFAHTVTVRLEAEPDGVTLAIADDGVGFSPAAVRRSSWGLHGSVVARMADVGGTAEVTSEAGAGTCVRLRWARDAVPAPAAAVPADRHGLLALALGDVRKPLAAVCVPYLLSMYVVAVVHTGAVRAAGVLIAWYSVVVVITLVLICRAHRPVPGWAANTAATFTVAGLLFGLSAIPRDSLDDFGSWPIGAVSPLLVVLLTVRSARAALVPLVVEEGAVLFLTVTGRLDAGSPDAVLPALLAPALGVVMVGVIVRTVLRLAAVVSHAHREQVAIAVAEAGRQALVELRRRRLAELGTELLPFLREAGAAAEADRERLRVRAHALEDMARDELHLPGVIDAELRARLGAARRAGCLVTFQSDTDAADPPAVLRELLAGALAGSTPPQQLTLSLHPGVDSVEVSLVTVPGDVDRGARLRRRLAGHGPVVEEQPEATCVRLVLPRSARRVPASGDMTA